MYQIKLFNKISESGLSHLDPADFTYSEDIAEYDGIIVRSAALHDVAFPDTLEAIARAGAGVNNIPVDACSQKGIVVFNTPGANANAVKELVLAGLFLSSRDIVGGIEWARTLKGQQGVAKLVEKGKSSFVGPEIEGKTLGVIGLGAIGAMVANAAHSLGMDVYGYDPYMSVKSAWGVSRHVKHAKSLGEIYANCDYITIHVPLSGDTKGMLNKAAFAQMKDGVRILNFSRGGLVDNDDMKEALDTGKVAVYVTDFPDEAALEMPNCITIPHLGASTPESEENCAVMAAQEISDYLKYGNIKNSVNFPDTGMEPGGCARVCIIHENIPNMIGQFSALFGNAKINIDNMLNKSKGEYAYTMIDIGSPLGAGIVDSLKAMDGVIKVRVID